MWFLITEVDNITKDVEFFNQFIVAVHAQLLLCKRRADWLVIIFTCGFICCRSCREKAETNTEKNQELDKRNTA